MTRLRIIGIVIIFLTLGLYLDYALKFSDTSLSKNSVVLCIADKIYLIVPGLVFGVLFILLGRKEGWGSLNHD